MTHSATLRRLSQPHKCHPCFPSLSPLSEDAWYDSWKLHYLYTKKHPETILHTLLGLHTVCMCPGNNKIKVRKHCIISIVADLCLVSISVLCILSFLGGGSQSKPFERFRGTHASSGCSWPWGSFFLAYHAFIAFHNYHFKTNEQPFMNSISTNILLVYTQLLNKKKRTLNIWYSFFHRYLIFIFSHP